MTNQIAGDLPLSARTVRDFGDQTLEGVKSFTDNIVITKNPGYGIKVDNTNPSFGWKDLIPYMLPDLIGVNSPTLTVFRGGSVRRYSYTTNDKMDLEYHIPHDYVPGTDVFFHIHWAHNGTAISGNLVVTFTYTYSKGHAQDIFSAEKTITITYNTVNITTTPRWVHRIDEVQFSSIGGSVTLLDTNLLEPDGVIGGCITVTGIPIITGGTPNNPYIFFSDIHYQSTQLATKQKAPNFYV